MYNVNWLYTSCYLKFYRYKLTIYLRFFFVSVYIIFTVKYTTINFNTHLLGRHSTTCHTMLLSNHKRDLYSLKITKCCITIRVWFRIHHYVIRRIFSSQILRHSLVTWFWCSITGIYMYTVRSFSLLRCSFCLCDVTGLKLSILTPVL